MGVGDLLDGQARRDTLFLDFDFDFVRWQKSALFSSTLRERGISRPLVPG
jgi:hypothetical protein